MPGIEQNELENEAFHYAISEVERADQAASVSRVRGSVWVLADELDGIPVVQVNGELSETPSWAVDFATSVQTSSSPWDVKSYASLHEALAGLKRQHPHLADETYYASDADKSAWLSNFQQVLEMGRRLRADETRAYQHMAKAMQWYGWLAELA